jgi:hypothetical protein
MKLENCIPILDMLVIFYFTMSLLYKTLQICVSVNYLNLKNTCGYSELRTK